MEERSVASYLFEIVITVLVWIFITRILNRIMLAWMNRNRRRAVAKATTA